MEIRAEDYNFLIRKFSVNCYKKLPEKSKGLYSVEDLMQEGKLKLLEAEKKFDKKRGTKFITYLFRNLQTCYSNLLTKEINRCKADIYYDLDSLKYGITPEQECITYQKILSISLISEDVARLLIDGLPDDFLRFIKFRCRKRHFKNKKKSNKVLIRMDKTMISEFYGINFWYLFGKGD